jgi:glycerophosphoryl diester phosphodiesterase
MPKWLALAFAAGALGFPGAPARAQAVPGSRVVMDAHNCYPYFEWWSDRIDRALRSGLPVAIEEDLLWHTDARSGRGWGVVSHGPPSTGEEPKLKDYFFERVRPVVEKALREGNPGNWPLITLNLDWKSEQPEHLAEIRETLAEYRGWITTAKKTADLGVRSSLDVKPLLVLTGESDPQKEAFYDRLPVGGDLLVFGAVRTDTRNPQAAPEVLAPEPADNYHRWWNNSWRVVESAGQEHAGAWTRAKESRLQELVRHAHRQHLWIRFYTLDGARREELSARGWFKTYNFGSEKAARRRWDAAIRAGVDYIASDQYEALSRAIRGRPARKAGADRAQRE